MKEKPRMGIVYLSPELYHYMCSHSFERAMKTPYPGEQQEFRDRLLQLEQAFRNTEWESS